MDTLREVFDPNFLLRNSVYMSLLVGLTCPLVGVYLVLRRLVFMGVALPQISSCGIAFAFALESWGVIYHAEGSEHTLAFAGSSVFTLTAILLFPRLERRGRGFIEGVIGMVYVLAGAWSILLLVKNPYGEHGLLDRLKGEIIAVSNGDLAGTAAAFAVVVAALLAFQKEFMLVSFDREMAITLNKNVMLWDSLLFLLIGLTISMAVLSVGPLVTFGFLLIPPLTAHLFARNMRQFALIASSIGGLTALAGFCVAYRWDFPVGPTDVALLGLVYVLAFLTQRAVGFIRTKPADAAARPAA
ncbi:MAG: metal ABC transporter permease [Verrucomicrobia bacterium]|nr:metal ABC transporter permease [Verrucomicrobiota bacterium]